MTFAQMHLEFHGNLDGESSVANRQPGSAPALQRLAEAPRMDMDELVVQLL